MYIPGATTELIELATIGEDDESNLSITEDRELISLLEKAIPSLSECDLPIDFVLYSLQLYPPSSHLSFLLKKIYELSSLFPVLVKR